MAFPVDEKWVLAAEQELGKRLPKYYRDRLLQENGGSIDAIGDSWELHPIFDRSDRKRIARSCNHILAETESARSWRGFPAGALVIAQNGTGDLLVLLVDESCSDSFGSVVFHWNHETAELNLIGDFSAFST